MTSILIEKYAPIIIMLVEDNTDNQFFFSDALSELDIPNDLRILNDGTEAIHYLDNAENPRPDIIFLDLNMPKMNGIECLKHIRKEPDYAEIPIVILSTSTDKKDVNEGFNNGANLYFEKPFSYDILQAILDKIFRLDWQPYYPPSREAFLSFNSSFKTN